MGTRLFLIPQVPMPPFHYTLYIGVLSILTSPTVKMWWFSTWLWVSHNLHFEYKILKINKINSIGMLECQLTSNQQVGGSGPPGIAMLSCVETTVVPRKLPVSFFVEGLSLSTGLVACHSKSGFLSDRRVTSKLPTSASVESHEEKHHPQWVRQTTISKGWINGSLAVVVDLPVWAMVLSKSLCAVFAAVTFFLRWGESYTLN